MLKAVSIYKNGLKIIHINGESLLKKIDELRFRFTYSNDGQSLSSDHQSDVICVSEAWCVRDLCDFYIACNGFNVFRLYWACRRCCYIQLRQQK